MRKSSKKMMEVVSLKKYCYIIMLFQNLRDKQEHKRVSEVLTNLWILWKNLDSDSTAEKTWKNVWRVQFVAQNMRRAEICCSQSDISLFAEHVKKIRLDFTDEISHAMAANEKNVSYNVGSSFRKSNLHKLWEEKSVSDFAGQNTQEGLSWQPWMKRNQL